MKGFGTVVTGSSHERPARGGRGAGVLPGRRSSPRSAASRCTARTWTLVEAGHRTAINLQGIDKEQVNRGDMAATPDSLVNSTLLDADFHYLGLQPRQAEKPAARCGSMSAPARSPAAWSSWSSDEVQSGEDAAVQLLLLEPAAVWPGDRYVVRSYSPVRTIGGGTIRNNAPPKRKRTTPQDREHNRRIFDSVHRRDRPGTAAAVPPRGGPGGPDPETTGHPAGRFRQPAEKTPAAPGLHR